MKSVKEFLHALVTNPFLLVLLLFAIYSSFLIFHVADFIHDDHIVRMSQALLRKDISLPPNNLPQGDYVLYQGMVYVYFGLFPSILLIPGVLLMGAAFPQVAIGIGSLIITFFAVYSLSKRLKFSQTDSIWLAIFFVFSTVFLAVGLINITAYQIQALGVVLMMLALNEQFGKKRYWLIGLLLGFAGLTRFVLFAGALFFFLEILKEEQWRKKLVLFMIPLLLCVVLNSAYNQRRFDSIIETGYQYNITLQTSPMREQSAYGFLAPVHIPANLYALFLKSPEPVLAGGGVYVLEAPYVKAEPWGMAIWYTSPLFLYLITTFKRAKYTIPALLSTGILLIPSLLYFGIGFSQFGYRYALDFLPFLFMLVLPSFNHKLPLAAKVLITIGVLVNCLLIGSLWGQYPQFGIK